MGVTYVIICPKCANFGMGKRICEFCNIERIPTETEFDDFYDMPKKERNELVEHYIETLIKDTYDPEARKYREENYKPVTMHSTGRKAKCPSCGSRSLSKISSVKKAAKVGLFGIFGAGDIGKTYKCNNCGVRF